MSRKVQKVDTGKDDQESTEQRNCVDGIGGIEPLEENKRGAECGSGERDVVQGVDTVSNMLASHFVTGTDVASFPPSTPTYMDVEN